MSKNALARRVAGILEPTIANMGYELVRVQLSGREGATLQIMAERRDRAPMTVDDCADISRAASALLDVEDPIEGAYSLEVSSPGLDRPLVRRADFERFIGQEAKILAREPVDGRRRFRGRLLGLVGDDVRIEQVDGGEEVLLAVDDIEKANLIATDDEATGDLRVDQSRDTELR